nr:phosphatidylethanolamine-binding protein 4 isoform X2 [Columba livia]
MSFLCALLTGSLCTLQGETEAARSPTHSEKLGFGRRAELFCSSWTGLKLRGTISMATSKLQSCLPIFRTCWPSRGGHQVHQMEPGEGRMKLLGAVLLGAVLLSSPAQLSKPEEQPQVCYFDVLSGRDSRFCRGELQVIYPDVGDVSCIYMPKCHQYRWRIIRDWMRPRVRFPQADENKKYVLVLADPDTPSREKPWNQYWRHWLVADIPGAELRSGDIKGRVLSDYIRPTPTPRSGYHRYQFRLYRQPANATIALTREESISFFRWPLMKFVKKYRMGSPVAATQFLTKHYED